MLPTFAGQFYNNLNICFSLEGVTLYALKLTCDRFRFAIPSHSHSGRSYEIHYVPSGFGKITLNHISYRVVPNTLYVTGPHVEHSQVPDKADPMVEYCVYLKIDTKKDGGAGSKPAPLLDLFEKTPLWFGQDTQNIQDLMSRLFQELSSQQAGYTIQVETLLKQLVVLLVRNYEQKRPSRVHFPASNIVDRNYLIIEECFLYEYPYLTLETLAQRLGLSTRQTERLLDRHYGKTFLKKRTEARMSAALILIEDSSRSITGISEELGYSTVEHFSDAFKRYYGASPRAYRKGREGND